MLQRIIRSPLGRLAALALVAGCATTPNAEREIAFVDVAVVAMLDDGIVANRTVIVRGDRIAAIGPSASTPIPPGAIRVDGRGRYLLPGLCDMHVHVWNDNELPLYVANGVTTVRNMWGSAETLRMRRRVERGELVGPRIVTAGLLTDGDPPVWGGSQVVRNDAEVRAAMDAEQKQGYDFLKIYENIDLDTFDAIAAYSREIGYPFAGHVPQRVSMERMIAGGAKSIEHLSGFADAERVEGGPYRPRSAYRSNAERRKDRAETAMRVRSGQLAWSDVFDSGRRTELAVYSAAHDTWNVPTLVVNRRIQTTRAQARIELERPEMRFVDPVTRSTWNPSTDFRLKTLTDEQLDALDSYFSQDLARVAALNAAGARLLAGTDAPNPFVVHGFAIHEELELLVRAGLSPYAALRAATRSPADFVGEAHRFGTVEVGARADLVLLEANPLDDIAATRRIAGVALRGRWLPKAELDGMLDSIARGFVIPDDWFTGVALPAGMDRPTVVDVRFNGVSLGAERYATTRDDTGSTLKAQSAGRYGNDYAEELNHVMDSRGETVSLDFTRSEATARTRARVQRDGGSLVLSGTAADGTAISASVEADGRTILMCGLVACLHPLLPKLRALEPGQSTTLTIQAFDLAPKAGLYAEQWTVKRAEDRSASRYEVTIERAKSVRSTTLDIDETGIRSIAFRIDLGVAEATRRDRGP